MWDKPNTFNLTTLVLKSKIMNNQLPKHTDHTNKKKLVISTFLFKYLKTSCKK